MSTGVTRDDLVIGTAGHIDHGKSRLVQALTGVDPDRLAEEKARGMTIDLGFASLVLPSGRVVAFVDVPGHNRFVPNMLAGTTGVRAALLVVAGDEGVMAQTREHAAILDLLGMDTGIVALTKADLIEPDLLSVVREEVAELVSGTSLAGYPVVEVSAVTGQGLEELCLRLDEIAAAVEPGMDGPGRLSVDRVFTATGFGTVVTGTMSSGRFITGQEVEMLPSGVRARIRGMQIHDHQVDVADAVSRVAINLSGVERQSLRRGDVVSRPGSLCSFTRFEAEVCVLRDSPVSVERGREVVVYAGTSEARAQVFPTGGGEIKAGERRWARVRLARPLPIWRGQVLILRLASPAHTIGAVTVARPGASRGSLHLDDSRLAQLLSDDPADVLLSLLQEGPASAAKLAMLSSLPDATVSTCLADLAAAGRLEPLGDRYVLPAMAEEIRRRALEHLAQFHERQPLRPGMAPEQLRRELRLDVDGFAAVVSTLRARGALSILHTSVAPGTSAATRDVVLALTEHARGERAAALKGDVEAAVRAVESARFMPPSGKDLRDSYKLDQETLRYLCRTGRFVRLTSDFFMATGTYHEMVDRVTGAILARGRITVAEIRDLLGVSRKYALAFGDHLDSEHITRRVGDERVLTSRFHARGG